MTDTMVQTFANFGVNVATSFYSGHADVHDRITGTPGSFPDTLCGIRSVLAHGLTLRVGMIAMDEDVQALQEANELLCNLGVSQENIRVDRVRPVGRGAKRTPFESLEKTLCGACWEGKLAVSYDGTCYPCVFFRQVPVGNVTEQGIDAIVRSQRLQIFRESMFNELTIMNCTPDCNPAGPCNPNCNPKCAPPCDPNCNPLVGCHPNSP